MNQATTPSTARHTIGKIHPAAPGGGPPTGGTSRGGSDKPVTDFDALTELFLGDGCLAPGPGGQL